MQMRNQWCNQIGGSNNGNVNLTLSLRISNEDENHRNYDATFRKNLLRLDLNFSGPNTQEPSYIGAQNGGAGDRNLNFTSLMNNNTATGGFIGGNYYDGQSSTAVDNSHLITPMPPIVYGGPTVHFAVAPPPPPSPLIPDLNVEFRLEDNSAADAPPPPPPPPPPPSPLTPDLNVEFRHEDNSAADATMRNYTVNVPAEGSTDAVVQVRVPRTRRKRSTEVIYNDPNRKCKDCKEKNTPMWRKGPLGPKTLCNACGIQYRKEEEKNKKARTEAAGANN